MGVKVGSARINEKGTSTGGRAGDQTGGEVSTQSWYMHTKGWIVIRAKDPVARERIAKNMEAACANNHIGYCQSHRTSATSAAKPYGYDLSKVTVDVETDCSELVRVCCLYAGISVGTFNTSSQKNALQATGAFEVLMDGKYCNTPDYLLRGDILVTRKKGHTVVVLSDGDKASEKPLESGSSVKVDAARSFDKSVAGEYRTTANLHLRAGAGTNKRKVIVMPAGTEVHCYGYYTLYQGKKWLYVQVVVSGKQYTGFCSSAYLSK